MDGDLKSNQLHLSKSKKTYIYLIFLLISLLLSFFTGLFAKKIVKLQNDLKQCIDSCDKKTNNAQEGDSNVQVPKNSDSSSNNPRDINSDDSGGKIINGGSITDAISLSTEKWTIYSSKLNNGVSFSFKYPENLYAVEDSNEWFSILNFFENEEASKRYISCVKDPTTAPGSVITRNWEGACIYEEDLLFEVVVGPRSQGGNNLSQDKQSNIIEYSSPDGGLFWKLPKNENYITGILGRIFIISEGTTVVGNYDNGVVVQLKYPEIQSVAEKTKNLIKMDYYPLLIHILSTFKIKN